LAALFVAAAAAAHFLHVTPVLAFAVAAAAIALLARLVGGATEQLGGRVGSSAAGVVQSALGNLPELFIALFALHRGLVGVCSRASSELLQLLPNRGSDSAVGRVVVQALQRRRQRRSILRLGANSPLDRHERLPLGKRIREVGRLDAQRFGLFAREVHRRLPVRDVMCEQGAFAGHRVDARSVVRQGVPVDRAAVTTGEQNRAGGNG